MPVAEYLEWQEYERLEPFGEMRADLRSGMIAATFANIHRKENTPAYSVADFMPFLERPEQQQLAGEELDDEARSNLILASCFGITA